VVAGQRADDPLYLPLIARVRAILRQLGFCIRAIARWPPWSPAPTSCATGTIT
jgi:hypothetical protein